MTRSTHTQRTLGTRPPGPVGTGGVSPWRLLPNKGLLLALRPGRDTRWGPSPPRSGDAQGPSFGLYYPGGDKAGRGDGTGEDEASLGDGVPGEVKRGSELPVSTPVSSHIPDAVSIPVPTVPSQCPPAPPQSPSQCSQSPSQCSQSQCLSPLPSAPSPSQCPRLTRSCSSRCRSGQCTASSAPSASPAAAPPCPGGCRWSSSSSAAGGGHTGDTRNQDAIPPKHPKPRDPPSKGLSSTLCVFEFGDPPQNRNKETPKCPHLHINGFQKGGG